MLLRMNLQFFGGGGGGGRFPNTSGGRNLVVVNNKADALASVPSLPTVIQRGVRSFLKVHLENTTLLLCIELEMENL